MKFVRNIVLLLALLSSSIYACPTCNIESLTVNIDVNMEAHNDHTLLNIQWKFPKKFLLSLIKHDKNKNGILDESEQKEIQNDLDKSWKEHDFYTFVKLLKKDGKLKENKGDALTILTTTLDLKEDTLIYQTKLKSNMVLQKDYYIYLRHFDKKMHYLFRLDDVVISKYNGELNINKKKYIAYIEFFKKQSANTTCKKDVKK